MLGLKLRTLQANKYDLLDDEKRKEMGAESGKESSALAPESVGGTGKAPSTTHSGATVETTTAATPEGSVSASGWLSWPKFCWHNALCAVFICLIAVSAGGGAFAYFSHGSDSLLPSIVPDATALPTERGPLFAPFNPTPDPVVPDPPAMDSLITLLVGTQTDLGLATIALAPGTGRLRRSRPDSSALGSHVESLLVTGEGGVYATNNPCCDACPLVASGQCAEPGARATYGRVVANSTATVKTRTSGGRGPCALAAHPGGRLLVANYYDGRAGILGQTLQGAVVVTERLAPVKPYVWEDCGGGGCNLAHDVAAVDCGTDSSVLVAIQAPNSTVPGVIAGFAPGTGALRFATRLEQGRPRRILPHPTLRDTVYILFEDAAAVQRWGFTCHAQGGAIAGTGPLQTARTVPEDRPADLQYGPSEMRIAGDHLYVANRGSGLIAVIPLDPPTGAFSPEETAFIYSGGDRPREMAVRGRWLVVADETNHTLASIRRDPASGALSGTPADTLRIPGIADVQFSKRLAAALPSEDATVA